MIEGLLRHCTDTEIEADYADTHGASVVGFAFTAPLNLRLPPGPTNIGGIRLHRPDDTPPGWPTLGGSPTQGTEKGPHPSPATVTRMPREHDAQTTAAAT